MKTEEINVEGIEEEAENVDFSIGDEVDILVYKFTDLGVTVIINNQYFGLVYENDIYKELAVGDKMKAYIKKVRHDNRIDLSLRKIGYGRIEDAKQKIFERLKKEDGFLPLNDSSSPELIKKELEMSKNSFKKAIGGLYKEELINITDQGIRVR